MVVTMPDLSADQVPNREQRRAAGYTGGKRVYKLTFEDPDMDGLVLRARSVPFRKLLELARVDTTVLGKSPADLSDEDVELMLTLIGDFADCIVEWNLLDDDGEPVEATVEAVLDQDPSWVMRVFMAWMQAIASVPVPLGSGSPSGRPSLEDSLQMAPRSPSPPS